MTTLEEKFWSSKFGEEYTKRNYRSNKELDCFYIENLGVPRSAINKEFLDKLRLKNILEVGCNAGNQLTMLQNQGFKNLFGILLIKNPKIETVQNIADAFGISLDELTK